MGQRRSIRDMTSRSHARSVRAQSRHALVVTTSVNRRLASLEPDCVTTIQLPDLAEFTRRKGAKSFKELAGQLSMAD